MVQENADNLNSLNENNKPSDEAKNILYLQPNLELLKNSNNNNIQQPLNTASSLKNNNSTKYIITIIENDEVKSICLDDLKKEKITFGRGKDNDIIFTSFLVSTNHGYFTLKDHKLSIHDNNSKNGLYVNNLTVTSFSLKDGDAIKIDNPLEPLNSGIIMIVICGDQKDSWKQYNLRGKESITIGRGKNCDIVLDHISISMEHIKISRNREGRFVINITYGSSIILNGKTVVGQQLLKDRDVILIHNFKLIYSSERIYYQIYDNGVRLEAIDIVKTVKVKGKKKDISYHVNFVAEQGEFIAFVGGSGTGKSTFMKCISGVDKPTSGQVLLNGEKLFENYSVLKQLIGYVPQDDIVYDDLTLYDMLKFAANLRMPDDASYEEKNKRINSVLSTVELYDKKDVMIKKLSGGQRKRACIAVELLADPKLFFLDEPTSGLDPGIERSIMKTLRKMADSGKTVILVTHNTLNLHLCDKVVFFGENGKKCFDGPPADALKFFEVNDFVDVYTLLAENLDYYYDKFNATQTPITYNKTEDETDKKENIFNNKTQKNNRSFFKQTFTLLARLLKKLINNRQQLLMLLLQAPILAYLISILVTNDLFYSYEETKSILFCISVTTIWLGLLNSIQEICDERAILEKEYMADLKLSAYMASKVIYLCLLAAVQAFLLITTFRLFVDVPDEGIIFGWYIDSIFTSFITIISASAMGLLVSCFSKNSAIAMTYAPIILVPQILYANILFELEGLSDFLSNFILCRWSNEALGTINDLNGLVSEVQAIIPAYVREEESYFTFTITHYNTDIIIMLLLAIILISMSFIILKRRLESDG